MLVSGFKQYKGLNRFNTIRPLIAALLLLIAMLGSTPKKYLHDAFAGHSDAMPGSKSDKAVVTTSVYQCGFDHQVATSPFVEGESFRALPDILSFVSSRSVFPHTDAVPGFSAAIPGRGPPSGTLICC